MFRYKKVLCILISNLFFLLLSMFCYKKNTRNCFTINVFYKLNNFKLQFITNDYNLDTFLDNLPYYNLITKTVKRNFEHLTFLYSKQNTLKPIKF